MGVGSTGGAVVGDTAAVVTGAAVGATATACVCLTGICGLIEGCVASACSCVRGLCCCLPARI
jgi:hypothetical protein